MLNSLRKRDSNPPNYTDLERNSIPQLQKILLELNVIPPSTSDRDELIQLIKLKITPRKSQRRQMYQRAAVDDDSSVENNFNGNDDFNVSNDQYDDAPISNENIDNSQNSTEINEKDENAPSAESMMADDELSNSAFEVESSITTPQRPSSKLFPSKTHPPVNNDESDDNQSSEYFDQSDSFGWGSSSSSNSRSQIPQKRMRFSPIRANYKRKTPSSNYSKNNNLNTNKVNHINSNKKHHHTQKTSQSRNSELISIKILLFLFILFLILFFLILALIPLPDERKYLPHCPKRGECDLKQEGNTTRYKLNRCKENYTKIASGLIQMCAPSDSAKLNVYKSTLEAAAYVSRANGDCFFNHEQINIPQIQNLYPQANTTILLSDIDFLTKSTDNGLKSEIPHYESTCRAFRACDNNPALTGLVVLLAFIASYVITKRFSNYNNI